MAYETTEVAVEKSQAEIRKLLYAHGARNFSFAETEVDGVSFAAVDFIHHDQRVRVRVPLKPPSSRLIEEKTRRSRTKTREQIVWEVVEQEAKRIWRVLFHGLKARLISVEEGVETFEEAFLAHLVDPVTGITMWEAVKGVVEGGALRIGGAGIFTAGPLELPAGSDDDAAVDADLVEDGNDA
jgi:hypothetical protein